MEKKFHAGALLLEKQIDAGVRPIVEALDDLRFTLSCDSVLVLTPKAEVRLRTGYRAQIPLKVRIKIKFLTLEVTFDRFYPYMPIEVDQLVSSVPEIEIDNFRSSLIELCNKQVGEYDYTTCQTMLRYVLEFVNQPQFQQHDVDSKLDNTDGIIEEEDIEEEKTEKAEDTDNNLPERTVFAACRACRSNLFQFDDNVHEHSTHIINKRRGSINPSKCTSVFLTDQPEWLQLNDDGQGKINCPKCEARIGQWSWVGSKCSCGEWISPNFQFIISKFDTKLE